MNDKLVTIASFSSDFEAEIARGKLRASGIDSFVFKDDCGGMRPHMLLTAGIQLKVNERESEDARIVLQSGVDDEIQMQSSDEEAFKRVQLFLNRARGWVLVGFAIIPGWISFPISYIYATKASSIIKDNKIDDINLKNKISRIRLVSVLLSLLFWTVLFFYVAEHLTNR